MKTITFYKRVSTLLQVGDDKDGLQRQQRGIEQFMSTFPNVDKYQIETIEDAGLSGYSGANISERGALGQYLQRVERGDYAKGSLLVCDEQSRITRLPYREALGLLWGLEAKGIIIWSIKDNRAISGEEFSNDVMLMLNAKGANDYSAEIARKVGEAKRKKQREVRLEGKGNFGAVCPGWLTLNADGKTFDQIPEHVQTVQRIFELRYQGYSMAGIAAKLNETNTPLITNRNWKTKAVPQGYTQSTIKNILNNPRVMGDLPESQRRGAEYPAVKGYYGQPIIPLEHWLIAQENLSIKGKRPERNENNPYAVRLFKSLVVCKFCGHKMDVNGSRPAKTAKSKPFRGSLICRNARENACMNGEHGTRTPALNMKGFETSLTNNLFRVLKQNDISSGVALQIAELRHSVNELQQLVDDNAASLVLIKNATARLAIIQEMDKLGDELEEKKQQIQTMERKQQLTATETLDGLNLECVDGRIEAQRVIAKTIRLIEVDTVRKVCDITLMNGNMIKGFCVDVDSTVDNTDALIRMMNNKFTDEIEEVLNA